MGATKTSSVQIALCIGFLLLLTSSVKSDNSTLIETKPNQQSDLTVKVSTHDIDTNTIAGSSNYIPERTNSDNTAFVTVNSVTSKNESMPTNNTSSQANVYQASTVTNPDKDPLMVNAQSNNPFISGSGGVNPQITMLLRNNPRLAMLARQNPMVAQQIMRNPQMLRDPAVQRAINSQLQPGQRANLINQLGNIGLLNGIGRALNPLGIGVNRGQNNQNNGYNNGVNNGGLSNGVGGNGIRNGMGGNGMGGNGLRNNLENNYRMARNQQPQRNSHSDTLPGGYYGNNRNYGQPNAQNNHNNNNNNNNNNNENENEGNENEGNDEENAVDTGNQDYDDSGNSGEGNQEGGEEQNPAEDPDIQQLQNFGGGGDNFPEGLFPPGLLSKEDMDEIRKQQEKQAREEQQRQQQEQGNQSPDYENGGGGGGGEDGEGNSEESGDNGNGEEAGGQEEVPTDEHNGQTGQEVPGAHNGNVHNNNNLNNNNNGNAYGQAGHVSNGYATTPSPIAYQNSYQPIQPQPIPPQRTPVLQPGINYANQYPPVQQPPQNGYPKNRFNYQPSVEYDQQRQPQYNPVNQYQYTTTPPPAVSLPSPGIAHQYQPNRPTQLYNTFNNQPHPHPNYNLNNNPSMYGQVPQTTPLGGNQYPQSGIPRPGIPRPGQSPNRMWPQQVYNSGPGYTPQINGQQYNNPVGIGMPNVRNVPNYPNYGNGQPTPMLYQSTPSPAYQSNFPLTNDRNRAIQSSPVLFR